MGIMGGLYSNNMFKSNPPKASKSKSTKSKKKRVSRYLDTDKILPNSKNIKILASDWLRVSSPEFKNNKKYPQVPLPNYSPAKIKVNKSYFRINQTYKKSNGAPSNQYFWFRLSKKNFYYSTGPEDLNVLGSISVSLIKDVIPFDKFGNDGNCFKVVDLGLHKWKVCAKDLNTKHTWICKIKNVIGKKEEDCLVNLLADGTPTVLTKKITQPIILIPTPSRRCNEGWDYQRKGDDWDCDCSEGKEQSPINLPPPSKSILSPVKPLFRYDEVPTKHTVRTPQGQLKRDQYLKFKYDDAVLKIHHDDSFGKIITLDGAVYFAQDIVFHTPSEHKIHGKRYEMEMQIIHYGQTSGDIAKQVVLSFLFERHPGVYNKFIDDIDFFNLPNPLAKVVEITKDIYIPKIFYSSNDDDLPIMKPFSFYTYQGSLTAPPCTERTIHYVAATPIPLGSTALQLFKEAIKIPDMVDTSGNVKISTAEPSNYRNTQSINGRSIFYYNHVQFCGPDPPKKPERRPPGHYEKVKKKAIKYIHVEGEKPSGLPNSFVVSEAEAKGLQSPILN